MLRLDKQTQAEQLTYVARVLLRCGARTRLGFELVGYNKRVGHAYAALLAYHFEEDDDFSFGAWDLPPTIHYAMLDKGMRDDGIKRNLDSYRVLNNADKKTILLIANLMQRLEFSRMEGGNIGTLLPPQYVQFVQYMAAGFNQNEAAVAVNMTANRTRTAIEWLKRRFAARSMQEVVRFYLMAQDSPTTRLLNEEDDDDA